MFGCATIFVRGVNFRIPLSLNTILIVIETYPVTEEVQVSIVLDGDRGGEDHMVP